MPSAISVLQLQGPNAVGYVQRCWRPNQGPSELIIDQIRFGYTDSEEDSQGESVVVCRTGDDRVELHCHGGRFAAERIMQQLVQLGAMELNSLEHVRRTVADEIESQAIEDLTLAQTTRTTAILLDQWRGSLKQEFEAVMELKQSGQADLARERLQVLLSRYPIGSHLIKPWKIVLAGPPNVGKSSLLNMLLGYTRAIVHEQAGTTRDLLAEQTSFEGWPVELIDSAGVRGATDRIEAEGVQKTLEQVQQADCTLLLVDCSAGWTGTHQEIVRKAPNRIVLVGTKSDLLAENGSCLLDQWNSIAKEFPWVATSSLQGLGLEALIKLVVQTLIPIELEPGAPVPFRQHHREWIESMLSGLDSR